MKKWLLTLFCIHQSFALTVSDPTAISIVYPIHVVDQRPNLVTNEKGDAVLVWKDFFSDELERDVLKMSFKKTEGWSEPISVSAPEREIHVWKSFLDEWGKVLIFWLNEDDDVRYTARKNGDKIFSPKVFSPVGHWPLAVFFEDPKKIRFLNTEPGKKTFFGSYPEFLLEQEPKDPEAYCPSTVQMLKKIDFDYREKLGSGCSNKEKECIVFRKKREELSKKSPIVKTTYNFSTRKKGEPWTSYEEFSVNGPNFYHINDLEVSMDDQENVCFVGESQSKFGEDVTLWAWVRSSQDGWEKEPVFLGNPTEEIRDIRIKHDSFGNFMVIWTESVGKNSKAHVAYKPFGKSWNPPVTLSSTGVQTISFLELTPSGDFILIWEQVKYGKYVSIYGVTFSPSSQTWASPSLLSPVGKNCLLSGFAIDKDGKGLLSWLMPTNEPVFQLEVATVHWDP